jgi:hypothetical protein
MPGKRAVCGAKVAARNRLSTEHIFIYPWRENRSPSQRSGAPELNRVVLTTLVKSVEYALQTFRSL